MQKLKDMPSVGKLPLLRHCQEVQIRYYFLLFWDLHLQKIRRYWDCVLFMIRRIYYGGTVAAPVIRGIFENILPYLGIEKSDVSDFSAEGN